MKETARILQIGSFTCIEAPERVFVIQVINMHGNSTLQKSDVFLKQNRHVNNVFMKQDTFYRQRN